jgi:hypothetical protein
VLNGVTTRERDRLLVQLESALHSGADLADVKLAMITIKAQLRILFP